MEGWLQQSWSTAKLEDENTFTSHVIDQREEATSQKSSSNGTEKSGMCFAVGQSSNYDHDDEATFGRKSWMAW